MLLFYFIALENTCAVILLMKLLTNKKSTKAESNDIMEILCVSTKAPFTLYRITSERSDFHTGFGCCLHYATVIRYATRSKNHSALEVI